MNTVWLKRWLFTTNHKEVGILYLVTSFYFAFLAGILAFLMRTQLAVPSETFLQPPQYNEAVTMHGLIMVLWFLSPLGIAFANYFVPLQIGAADVAFARLNATSYWMYVFSGITAFVSFFVPGGSPASGWTNYSPLTSLQFSPGSGETLGAAALIVLAASNTVGTVNILVTILWHRAAGVSFVKLPMFTMFTFWTMLQFLWAFPSLIAGLIMLEADRLLGTSFFTSTAGGSILWDHVWWFFGHPEVYIVLLPAFGIVAGIIATFSGRPVYARKPLFAAVGIVVLLSYMVYGHHMFLTGISLTEREVFTINTEMISIPFGVLMLSFIGTMYRGAIRLTTPMLFALGSVVIFVIGGLSGVFNSSLALDIALRGTYFVVAHFHYVMVGASEFGLFAGIYYWLPKMTGRMYNETLGKTHFILSFVGFNLIFFPMFFLENMPRRIVTYAASTGWGPANFIATVGAFIFIPSQLLLVYNMGRTLRGPPAPANPWNSTDREWASGTSMPHSVGGPGHGLGNGLGNGVSHSGSESAHEASPLSTRPIILCLGFAVSMAGLAFLLGSYAFIRVNFPYWPAPGSLHDINVGTVDTIIVITSSLTAYLGLQSIKAGNKRGLIGWLGVTLLLGIVSLAIKGSEWYGLVQGLAPGAQIGLPLSSYFVTTGIHGAHVLAGMFLIIYLVKRAATGGFSAERYGTVENFNLYWSFVNCVWLVVFPLFYLL
ncbi:cytochrome C oxidase subunit I [Candidatus Bathyarchaeota archaeon]|nr:MAG: cytochrome C oxidase subunit I [Candidatus Bathyarchaeota archaeon]